MKNGDDFWVIEYVYLIFRFLNEENRKLIRSGNESIVIELSSVIPENLSPYFDAERVFYEWEHGDFLEKIEREQRRICGRK